MQDKEGFTDSAHAGRREFLSKAGFAAIATPAMTMLLSTTMSSPAIAASVAANNGLGNGEDLAPRGIAMQGKPQNDQPAVKGEPQYQGSGSDGVPNK